MFVPGVPLHMVRPVEIPPDVTGNVVIASYFHVGNPDTKQQTQAKGSGQEVFFNHGKEHAGTLHAKWRSYNCLLSSIAGLAARQWGGEYRCTTGYHLKHHKYNWLRNTHLTFDLAAIIQYTLLIF